MKKNSLIISLFFVISFTNISAQTNGKLTRVKENLNKENTTLATPDMVNEADDTDEPPVKHAALTDIVGIIVGTVTYGILVETYWELNTPMHAASLSAYPYVADSIGNYVYDNSRNSARFRFDINNSFLSSTHHLYADDFQAKFRFAKRFGLQFNYLYFNEKIEKETHQLAISSLMFNYHRIRTRRLDLWYGLGAMYVASGVNQAGITFNVGAEWFLARPISVAGNYQNGYIKGNSLQSLNFLLRYFYKKIKFSAGFRHFNLAGPGVNTYHLGVGYTF